MVRGVQRFIGKGEGVGGGGAGHTMRASISSPALSAKEVTWRLYSPSRSATLLAARPQQTRVRMASSFRNPGSRAVHGRHARRDAQSGRVYYKQYSARCVYGIVRCACVCVCVCHPFAAFERISRTLRLDVRRRASLPSLLGAFAVGPSFSGTPLAVHSRYLSNALCALRA